MNIKKLPEEYYFKTDLTELETKSIIDLLDKFESPKYLEIGVNFGGTFIKVLNFLKNKKDSIAVGCDLFEELEAENQSLQTHGIIAWGFLNVAEEKILCDKLKQQGYTNFKLVRGDSNLTIPKLDESFDVIFIDGNHTYQACKSDFEKSFEKSNLGSFFIFHNTTFDEYKRVYTDGGPFLVCTELMENKSLEYLGFYDTIKIFKRIK